MNVEIKANDQDTVAYLNTLWLSSTVEAVEAVDLTGDSIRVELMDQDNEIRVKLILGDTEVTEAPTLDTEVGNINIDFSNQSNFKKSIRENLDKMREIGFRVYNNMLSLEKEVNLNTVTVTDQDLDQVYQFRTSNYFTRRSLMTNICKCRIFPKYKYGNTSKPESFRYLVNHHNTVKILDRIWCIDVIKSCGQNLPDTNIFKANLIKSFGESVISTAINNTLTIDSVVLLDIEKAFDSLEWGVLKDLMLTNLSRKMLPNKARDFVDQYMTIIENRELYYNDKLVNVSKGVPTGLPSSNLVFTIAFEEIIHRWLNKYGYQNGIDFNISVYVDDIFIKVKDKSKANVIVDSLIDHLADFKLKVNLGKAKADPKLMLNRVITPLTEYDYYLGIPFTRNKKLYGQLILKEFNKNKMNISWLDIYKKLVNPNTPTEEIRIITGFMSYKLRPLILTDESEYNDKLDMSELSDFIYYNYAKEELIYKSSKQALVLLFLLVIMYSSIFFLDHTV